MKNKQKRYKLTNRLISLLLSALLFVTSFLLSTPSTVTAIGESLISDCTAGWSYSGNSLITYTTGGGADTYLSVNTSYGALRKLYCTFSPIDLSDKGYIVWDFKAVSDNSDMMPDVLKSYKDTFSVGLKDSSGKEKTVLLSNVSATYLTDSWYRMMCEITSFDIDIKHITEFSITGVIGLGFDTLLPETNYQVNSVTAYEKEPILPEIIGIQKNINNDLRILAKVNKNDFEFIGNNYSSVEYGFIIGNDADFSDKEMLIDDENVKKCQLKKIYASTEDEASLIMSLSLSGEKINSQYDVFKCIRAYFRCIDNKGNVFTFYSRDSYSGGYRFSQNSIEASVEGKEAINNMNIRVIEDDTPIVNVKKFNVSAQKGKPYVVNTKYDDGKGMCVAIYDVVRDFGAPVNNPDADSSPIIQTALNAAHSLGGGVVYVPEGTYYLKKPITIPRGVTLRGEWVSPEVSPAGSCGTIFAALVGTVDVQTTPFVSLKTGSGFRNITIIYPENLTSNPKVYAATLAQLPAGGSDSYSVLNTTVIGGTVGFDGATAWNELHYLNNVYFSCFEKAMRFNQVTDIGRLEKVSVSSKYLLENKFRTISDSQASDIYNYFKENATGLYLQRSDWEYVYDLHISGMKYAITMDKYIDTADNNRVRGSNGQMFGVDIRDCDTAFNVLYTNAIGYALSDINIKNCENGFIFSNDYLSSFEITNLNVTGNCANPITVKSQNNGKVTISNSKFGCKNVSGYVINVQGGNISVQQTDFYQKTKHIKADTDSGSVSVLGCTFAGNPDISRNSGRQNYVLFDDKSLDLPVSNYKHTYRRSIPTASSNRVYNIADYGAVSGQDSTAALKSALTAAGKTGGIVYVPAGEYTINEAVTVPTGVELRGIYDVPTHPLTAGSILCTDVGKNAPDSTAFVSLEEGSGINGISFYYPNQTYMGDGIGFVPYSYTVRSKGKNCWAINSTFINSYNALDFATYPSDGHYINYVSGTALNIGVFVGNNESNGWVEDIQMNPHYWKRATVSNNITSTADFDLNHIMWKNSTAIVFGDNASEHVLGTFAYGAQTVLKFVSQGKGGTNGVFIGHGSDGCQVAVRVEQLDCVAMINSELVSMVVSNDNSCTDMHHIVMEPTVTGTLAQFNMQAWAQPVDASLIVDSGNLIIAQLFYHNIEHTENIARVKNGKLYMSTAMLPEKTISFMLNDRGSICLKGNLTKQVSLITPPASLNKLRCSRTKGSLYQVSGWWI